MIIVAGWIRTAPGRRDDFVRASAEAVTAARQTHGNHDFSVTADSVDPDRVDVYERWETAADVESFRGAGPGDDLSADIVGAEVQRFEISSVGPA